MNKQVIGAVMRLFKGWDIANCAANTDEINRKLFSTLIAADMRNHTMNNDIAEIAVKTWGVSDFSALNNTFHKSFSTVENTDYQTLVYQQLLHYFTTYGAEFFDCYDSNSVYIPTDNSEIPEVIQGLKLNIIRPYTFEQIREKVINLGSKNIGFTDKVLNDIVVLYAHYVSDITIDDIGVLPNRELKMRLYKELNLIPSKADEFLRYIMFEATGSSLLIKNRVAIDKLRIWANNKTGKEFIYKAIHELNPVLMAQSYHRYHEYWLALKQKSECKGQEHKEINAFINRISRLADKHNKPLPINIMQNICNEKITVADVERAVEKSTDVQLLKAWGYLRFLKSVRAETKLRIIPRNYNIRNNTVWTKQVSFSRADVLYVKSKIIISELKKRFSHLANKKFYLPKNVSYSLYTSGKKTVGVVPQGTAISLPAIDDNLIIAIHWYDVNESRVDLDLHALTSDSAVGWHTLLKTSDCKILYSGDVTAAPLPKGATEAILVKGMTESIEITFNVNNYTMNPMPIPFDIIIAHGDKKDISQNYAINPNKILLKLSAEIAVGKSQMELGTLLLKDNVFNLIIGGCGTGNTRVCSVNEIQNQRREAAKLEFMCYPAFLDFLRDIVCAYEIVKSPDDADFDLSLNSLQSDTFSSMLFGNLC